ncbi:MAG TPA: lysoplasmalogenase [Candidatus Sulfotelmatobacter sp.]|nr:lysoplasmalogenase [Candidatus Sulfotelmatobacter sp.]
MSSKPSSQTSHASHIPFSALIFVAVALVLAGHLLPSPLLVYVSKPLATALILGMALVNWRGSRGSYSYSLSISIGLLFSLVGDIFLLWPSLYFIHGLAAFLLTHLAYLIAFTRDARFPARVWIWILYLAIAATLYAFLYPNLPVPLKLPLALYSALLSSMAAQAMGRFLVVKTKPAQSAAIGAVFFMLSDFLLAFDRFHTLILLAPVLILIPYYLGQWLIASSTQARP